ncbi:MAG: HEPN domain-containing protein [Candidatus Brockarchaeota archaeon]|nr:HEPN domain-containing protein [Candidatus Brockarchaeota archaeon]
MSLNPLSEIKYRHRLASENLERAERLFKLGDWVGVVSSSRNAVENFAKAVIAVFEVPTWSHDPSEQLKNLIGRLPDSLTGIVGELMIIARDTAPEHGRSAYGEPNMGLTPGDIYGEEHASSMLEKARRSKEIAENVLRQLKVEL